MESLKYMRIEDMVEAESGSKATDSIDLFPLLGTWINTNNQTRGITRVIVGTEDRDLTVQVFGACYPGFSDWGEVKAEVVYANSVRSHEAMAFSALYDFGSMEVHLEANLSLGLLVVAGLNTFKDASGRSNYFSREFFYHAGPGADRGFEHGASRQEFPKRMRDEEDVEVESEKQIDASPFLGRWITTNRATRGLVKIDITPRDEALAVQAFGACSPAPCDWGVTGGTLFSEGPVSHKGLAVSAPYDFGFMQTHLQAKIKKGVLVVAVFNRFNDGSARANYFSREFFYRI